MNKYIKHSIQTLSILAITLSLSSCSDFLDKDPYDRPSIETALSDIAGLTWAMNGTYDAMCGERYYGRVFIILGEYMGEDVKQKIDNNGRDTYGEVYRFTKNVETEEIERLWEYAYDVLLRSNNIIKYLPLSIDGTDEEKDELLAQSLFVRALAHFDLVRAYGQNFTYTEDASHLGVPIVTRPLSVIEIPSRNTVKEVYDQIIIDLKQAIETFPEKSFTSENAKYGNRYAAMALLSRVYMYTADYTFSDGELGWEKSIYWASQLLDAPDLPLSLIPKEKYVSSWSTLVPSSESLFELAFIKASSFSLGSFFYPGTSPEAAEAVPSYDLLKLYMPGDVRINMFHILSSTGEIYSKKYPGSDGAVGLDNIKILRLSEVYLNRAEAYAQMNMLTAAVKDLNKIRNRAGLPNVASSLNQEELLEEIYIERRRELAFEGHRFWDISRRHQDVIREDLNQDLPYARINYPSTQYVLPISEDELQANENMVQNEGYNE